MNNKGTYYLVCLLAFLLTNYPSVHAQSTGKSTGLGLYIAKKFAELMGGDVFWEASEPAKDSTFTLRLPMW